ncbi:hypothetical protein Pfo_020434 [Paulownia fortunei]|nr:hypothetical protein Pfo_020434 [Paulownia fortunei]
MYLHSRSSSQASQGNLPKRTGQTFKVVVLTQDAYTCFPRVQPIVNERCRTTIRATGDMTSTQEDSHDIATEPHDASINDTGNTTCTLWRNMQYLICDSGMIPNPEPYQSMYQQRWLGALRIEMHLSSVRFAVGIDSV